jgi:hypothetical protein
MFLLRAQIKHVVFSFVFCYIKPGMDDKEKQLLREMYEMTEENNRILKKMNRRAFWSGFFRLFYWVIVLAIAFGAYYYVQPYLKALLNTYNSISTQVGQVKNVTNSVQGVLNKIPVSK